MPVFINELILFSDFTTYLGKPVLIRVFVSLEGLYTAKAVIIGFIID